MAGAVSYGESLQHGNLYIGTETYFVSRRTGIRDRLLVRRDSIDTPMHAWGVSFVFEEITSNAVQLSGLAMFCATCQDITLTGTLSLQSLTVTCIGKHVSHNYLFISPALLFYLEIDIYKCLVI